MTSKRARNMRLEDPPSSIVSVISAEILQEQIEIVSIQAPQYPLIAAYPFTNSNAISIVKGDGSTHELTGMVNQYLISEENNSRENFEHIVYSIQIFTSLGWSFRDFFLGFEEMVLTLRKKLLESNKLIKGFTGLTIEKRGFNKSPADMITSNDWIKKDSLRKARRFINTFSLQIFKLFQVFYNGKDEDDHSKLTESIQLLWTSPSITTDEVNDLISMLGKCIGEINADDLLFINLSSTGFLKLREQLYRYLLESRDLLIHFKKDEKQQCIKKVETFIGNFLEKPYSFSKENSERLWTFLGEFYICTLPKSSERSALPIATLIPIIEAVVTEIPSTGTENDLTTVTNSFTESGSKDSKKRKERDVESSSPVLYSLRSRNTSSGGNNGSVLDADMTKLIEAREKAKTKARNKAVAKTRAQMKGIKVVVKKRKLDDNVSASVNDEAEYFQEEEEEEAADDDDDDDDDDEVKDEGGGAGVNEEEMVGRREQRSGIVHDCQIGEEDMDANGVAISDKSNDEEEREKRLFYEESRRLTDSYIDIADVGWEEDTSNVQPYSTGNLKLPSLENPQDVLEWLYEEMKDLFSTDVILQSLDIIVNGADSEADAVDKSNVTYESNQTSSSSSSSLVPSIAEKIALISIIDNSTRELSSKPTSFGSSSSPSSLVPSKVSTIHSAGELDHALVNSSKSASEFVNQNTLSCQPSDLSSSIFLNDVQDLDYSSSSSSSNLSSSSSSSSSLVAAASSSSSSLSSQAKHTSPEELRTKIRKEMAGISAIHDHIFKFIHPKLHWIIQKNPVSESNNPRPQKFPSSLYFRSNLYKCTRGMKVFQTYPPMYSCPIPEQKDGCFKVINDLHWCTDPFQWYVRRNPFIWPTCIKAVAKRSTFLLLWARMNRCSCTYDIREFRKLSPIEKQMLSWLEDECRLKLHSKAHFQGMIDTPETTPMIDSSGYCLWNAFVLGETQLQLQETIALVSMSKLRRNAATFESYEISEESKIIVRKAFEESFKTTTRQSISTSSQTAATNAKWLCDKFNSYYQLQPIVNFEVGIRLAKLLPQSSLNAIVALTILGQGTRMFMLQNETELFQKWLYMTVRLFGELGPPSPDREYIALQCGQEAHIISTLKHFSIYYNFGEDFVHSYDISIDPLDSTEQIAGRLNETLSYHANTGLYVFHIVQGIGKHSAIVPILLQKDGKHFQCVAAVYRSSKPIGKVLMRMVSRSLEGVCEYGYFQCQYYDTQPKGQPPTLKSSKPSPISDKVFPCKLNDIFDQLHCLVFVPTCTQSTNSGSNFSLQLKNSSEFFTSHWSVKDYQSLEERSHLTGKSLEAMVCQATSDFDLKDEKTNELNQDFTVSESLIEDLVSLRDSMQENDFSPLSPQLSILKPSLITFGKKCTVMPSGSASGVHHLLLGYKNVQKETQWIYAYFILHEQTLVVLPCCTDPVRDVMKMVTAIKSFLDIVLNTMIQIKKLLWNQVSTSSSNSGFYVFKQFLTNAQDLTNFDGKEHFLSKWSKLDIDWESDKIPSWILMNFTPKQAAQIKMTWRNLLFAEQRHSFKKLYELTYF